MCSASWLPEKNPEYHCCVFYICIPLSLSFSVYTYTHTHTLTHIGVVWKISLVYFSLSVSIKTVFCALILIDQLEQLVLTYGGRGKACSCSPASIAIFYVRGNYVRPTSTYISTKICMLKICCRYICWSRSSCKEN